ncbi:hypothetical protein [Oleiharenicola sp. Vm1]|uniref:hypothetical protein n=1 Tax=Oleiharenicola sp. Vm1 TaxID=3398393 RepID=UPI0039F52DC2
MSATAFVFPNGLDSLLTATRRLAEETAPYRARVLAGCAEAEQAAVAAVHRVLDRQAGALNRFDTLAGASHAAGVLPESLARLVPAPAPVLAFREEMPPLPVARATGTNGRSR